MDNQQALQQSVVRDDERRVALFLAQAAAVLVPGEQIDAWAVQRRLFALLSRRVFVIATTGRLLVFTRKLIAGYQIRDVRWQDVSSAHIRVGVFGADLTVGALDGGDLASTERSSRTVFVPGLRKGQAHAVYRLCQAHDQAWREKRRIRELEELRARAGGVQVGTSLPIGELPPAGGPDALERLKRAKDMLSQGLITDAEYEAVKAKVLSRI